MNFVVTATFSLVSLWLHAPVSVAAPAPAPSLVVRMNDLGVTVLRKVVTPPPLFARSLALLHLGMWQLERTPGLSAPERKAAGVELGCRLLRSAAPSETEAIDRGCAGIFRDFRLPQVARASEAARQTLQSLLDWRSSDAAAAAGTDFQAGDEWHWNPAPNELPALPQWGTASSFLFHRPSAWRIEVPELAYPQPDDERVSITLRLGGKNAPERTPEMTDIAIFWGQGSPAGQWNRVAEDAVSRLRLSHADSLLLFAQLNLALVETSVHCWSAKYQHNVARPIQIARAYGLSGWEPLIETPPHPEYPSGHSSFSGAAAAILESWAARFPPSPSVPIRVGADEGSPLWRKYESYTAAAAEAGLSRIYAGVHFLWSDTEGQRMGREIAAEVLGMLPGPDSGVFVAKERSR